MASSSLQLLFSLFLLPALTYAASSYDQYNLKSLHFTLYEIDTFNETFFITYPGLPGFNNASLTAAPFGSIFILNSPLTVGPSKTTMAVGTSEAFSITSTTDGLNSINIIKITFFGYKGLKGSMSVVGVANNFEPSDAPVSGGTGDLLFVQGYTRSELVSAQGLSTTYKIDFHLFWPPYAPFAMKG